MIDYLIELKYQSTYKLYLWRHGGHCEKTMEGIANEQSRYLMLNFLVAFPLTLKSLHTIFIDIVCMYSI